MINLRMLLLLCLILPTKFLIIIPSVQAQTGNFSNITGPDPINSIPFDSTTPPINSSSFDSTTSTTTENQEDNQQQTEDINNQVIREVTTVEETREILDSLDNNTITQTIETGNVSSAIAIIEEINSLEHSSTYGVPLTGVVDSPENISQGLASLQLQTGKTTAINYVYKSSNGITTLSIVPSDNTQGENLTKQLGVSNKRNNIIAQNENVSPSTFRNTISLSQENISQLEEDIVALRNYLDDSSATQKDYMEISARLYDQLIRPLTSNLESQEIDTLTFVLGDGIRGIPLATLYNRETGKYLIEEYSLSVIPSFGLTDVSYQKPDLTNILAVGSSIFEELDNLPAVPLELAQVVNTPRQGDILLNQEFTINNFKRQNQDRSFDIIHLATHAEFFPGSLDSSYIQFFDNKLSIPEMVKLFNELKLVNPDRTSIELLVLSACQTSVGSREAELGFAGIAVGLGVKSTLASMWSVSDLGTFALMSQFYENYTNMPLKAEALRQAQISLLKKEVYLQDNFIVLASGKKIALPDELKSDDVDFSDPFIWGAFQLIGNWN